MQKLPISLSVLTWKSPKTLATNLEYLKPILDCFDERILVCQESDPDEIAIGERYGVTTVALAQNVGIQNGLKQCFQSSRNDCVLFYENDLQLRIAPEEAISVLAKAHEAIAQSEVKFAKLRYLPDNQTDWGPHFHKYYRIDGQHIKKRLYGRIRRRQSDFVLARAVGGIYENGLITPGIETYSEGLLKTTSQFSKWENRALLCDRDFLLGTIIPYAEANPTKRSINGYPDLEHPLNSSKNRWR